ncbi:MAG: hypothetical protein IKG87_04865, partial [Clostridia bacterium]|nr:hypothetical protein [Clostridia bacterium]
KRAAGIIRQIARDNHVTEEEVRRDMKEAMDAGRSNPDPAVQAKWAGLSMSGTSRRWKSSFCGWWDRSRRVVIEAYRGLFLHCFSSVIRI